MPVGCYALFMSEQLHLVCPHCGALNRLPATRLTEAPNCGRCKSALFQGHPVELDETTFDTMVSRNQTPVLVDFWAPWCQPCLMMAPQFERAARSLEPHLRLAKLNTESAPAVASRHGIRSIPTLILFHGGRERARQPGAMDANAIQRWLKDHL